MDPTPPPTIDDIRAAAVRIDGAVVKTPMLRSRVLSDLIEADIWLKFENLQFTAAYKERGALNKLSAAVGGRAAARGHRRLGRQPCPGCRLSRPPARHSGDDRHAQPDALGEGHADRRATARVVLHGAMYDDAYAGRAKWRRARAWSSSIRSTTRRSSPGPAPSRSKCSKRCRALDTLVIPIGGGGLISGTAIAAKSVNPRIEVIGVEAELYPSMKNVVEGQHGISAATPWPRASPSRSRRADPGHHQGQGRFHRARRRARH